MKRSIDLVEDICAEMRPAKRLSMITNTPKQWKEQRRQILRLSKNKLKALGDVESNLRKSVLINNTFRKMRKELKEQCPYSTSVGFAPYSEHPRVVSNVKPNSGYTSMAKENLYQSSVCDNVPSVRVSTSSYKYSLLEEVESKSSLVSANNAVIAAESSTTESMQSELVDTDNVSPPKQDGDAKANDPISTNNNTHTGEAQHTGLIGTNDTPIMHTDSDNDTESPSEPIDFSLKAKEVTEASCSSGLSEHSPLHASAVYNDREPCADSTMDVEMTPRPSEQGQVEGHTIGGHTDSMGPESNSTTIDHLPSSSASHDAEDFSLCKYANRPLHSLPSLYSADLIPFSTSSLVSILASREYASHYRPVCAEPSQQQSVDSSKDTVKNTDSSIPQQDSTTTPAPTSSPAQTYSTSDPVNLFSLEDLESLEESMQTDTKTTDSLYEPFISCDSDTHLWQAAYQTFNMAVACS